MRITFTLDTNCIIDVEQGLSSAVDVRRLADAHAAGEVDVALVAVSSHFFEAREGQNSGAAPPFLRGIRCLPSLRELKA
jgi:hypothetical protein